VSGADLRRPAARLRLTDAHGLGIVGRTLLAVAAFAAVAGLSLLLTERWNYTLTSIATAALWAVCLNIVVGYTGQLNLSLGAFLALGAYIGTLATGTWGWPGIAVLLVVIAAAIAISFLLSLVMFRARGLHFALLTAGLSLVTANVLVTWTDVTGGSAGISTGGPITAGGLPKPLEIGPIVLSETRDYLLGTVFLVCFVLWLTTLLLRRREGAGWIAVREDEWLAASVGIKVANRKRVAFILCSTLAAVAGVLYAHWIGYMTPGMFGFANASFDPLAMVVLGGAGTVAGPLVGAVVVAGLPELFRGFEDVSILVYGLALLAVIMASPRGVTGVAEWIRDRVGGRLARRRREEASDD